MASTEEVSAHELGKRGLPAASKWGGYLAVPPTTEQQPVQKVEVEEGEEEKEEGKEEEKKEEEEEEKKEEVKLLDCTFVSSLDVREEKDRLNSSSN